MKSHVNKVRFDTKVQLPLWWPILRTYLIYILLPPGLLTVMAITIWTFLGWMPPGDPTRAFKALTGIIETGVIIGLAIISYDIINRIRRLNRIERRLRVKIEQQHNGNRIVSGHDAPQQDQANAKQLARDKESYDWQVYKAARMLAFIHQDCLTHLTEEQTTQTRKWAFQAVLDLLGTTATTQVLHCLQTMLDAEPDHSLRLLVPYKLREMGMIDRLAPSNYMPYATPTPR